MPVPEAPVSSPTPSEEPPVLPRRHVPTCLELFLGFGKIAVCGFGGVLAWSRRIIVQERGWLTPEEFNEQLALCQVLPGGNILNFSVMFGCRCAGVLNCPNTVANVNRLAVSCADIHHHGQRRRSRDLPRKAHNIL